MKKIFEAIMAVFINGIEFLTGFLGRKEYEGWMQGEKIWPADEISITYVQFLLESLPEGYTGLTKLTQIPACGASVRSAILTYQYDDGWGEHHIGEIQVDFTDGAISAESKYYTESGATLVGTRHADFEIDGVEFKDFAIEVYQEANVITKTDRSEPAVPLKEDAWYYYTPDIKAFSYTGAGLLASGGNATPSFRVSITKIMSRYLKTEKTWKDMQSTAMEQVGMAPRQIDVMGGVEEWVDISAPVTNEYTDTASGEVTIKFDASNLIAAASLVSYDTGVISVASMGTTSYPNGRTIGNAKIIVSVPRIRTGEQSRVEKSVTLSQGSNTMTQEWRVTTAATTSTEYAWEQPAITSISCALVGASGSPAKVIVAYSQDRYKYQYNISERKTLYEVWTSGEEVSTGMSTGGDKTLASKTVASTITSGGALAFGGSALNNSGATIDSDGWVTGVSLYRTVTEERDIFKAWATVTANGLTSAKSYVTVRQHYNHQYTENMSEGTAVTTIEYDYSAPSVTLKYYTGAGEESSKVTARGGSLYPGIKATQTSRTRSHTVGPTTWVWNYWDADPDGVETDKKTADYYSAWVDGQSYETTSLSDVIQWYGDEKKNGATVSSSDGTVSVPSLGTTSFSEGNVIKVVATVRMNGKTANGYCYISQGANTMTQEWRVTTAATTSTEYAWEQPAITSISCALVGASGSPAKVIVAYSQSKYKYQYNISERKTLYEVWTSGEEVSTGMSTGGDKTLASKTVASTITSGGTLAFGGSALNNSGATIDSTGWVYGVSLYRTVTEERDIFKAWATVTANGLTSTKSYITVRQHYNHQYTENKSEGTAVVTIEYDYSAPSVTLKYYTGAGEESYKVTARGGSLYPKIKATQTSRTRSHTVGPTTWVWNYWDADPDGVETDKKTANYYSAWVDGQSYETTSLNDVIQWYGDEAKNGASVASKDGTVTVPSLGTTSFSEGNVLKVVATVRMNGKTANGYCYISQGSNTKTVKSTAYTGIKSAELIDANGNKITSVLSYEAQMIFIRTQAIKTITYVWTSDAESTATEYEYKRADSYSRSNTSLFTIMDSWSYTLNAVPVSISKNTDKSNRRGGYIVAAINGKYATTQSITQEVNTEPESTTADTYLVPVSYQTSVTSDGQYVYVWDLKRTNKPMSASTVVNYSFTKAGPSVTPTTITGSVYVSASEAEGNVVKANVASGVMVVVVNYKETV